MTFEFVGVTSRAIDIDPTEYMGMSVPEIEHVLLQILKAIGPGVDFSLVDISMAAGEISAACDLVMQMFTEQLVAELLALDDFVTETDTDHD